jgi:hypothetical protein
MRMRTLGALLMLAAMPAFAQDAPETIPATAHQTHPMQFHKVRQDGTVESTNWSGYAVTGSSFTSAKGSWIVPSVNCSKTPNTYSAFWVGIDGYSSDSVEQTGTISQCDGTTAQYYAWYEFYPNPSYEITSVPVSPGNVISASVTYSDSKFTTTITNGTFLQQDGERARS